MDYTDVEGPYRGEDPNQTLGELLNQDKKNRPNRSTFVSTDVKDAIMLMLPSLIRLFGASENPVNLVPRSPADSDMAEQATSYVNYVFWNDNPGFLNLYGAIKDALTVRTGFLKWWSEDEKEVKRKRFTNINLEQLQMLLAEDPTAKVVDLGKPIEQNAAPIPPPIGNSPPRAAPCSAAVPPPAGAGGPPPPMGPPGPMAGAPPAGAPPGVQPPGAAGGAGPPNAGGPPGRPPAWTNGGRASLPAFRHGASSAPARHSKPRGHQLRSLEAADQSCGVPPEEMRLDR